MNKRASNIRVANRHFVASINTPVIEEVLPNTFSTINPEERTYITHKCMEALRGLSELSPSSIKNVILQITNAPLSFIEIDVDRLFTDVGTLDKEKLFSLI